MKQQQQNLQMVLWKVSDNKKKLQPTVDYMLNPRVDLKYNSSQTQLEQFAIGQVLQRVGVNKMVNAQAMLENYNSSVSCTQANTR